MHLRGIGSPARAYIQSLATEAAKAYDTPNMKHDANKKIVVLKKKQNNSILQSFYGRPANATGYLHLLLSQSSEWSNMLESSIIDPVSRSRSQINSSPCGHHSLCPSWPR